MSKVYELIQIIKKIYTKRRYDKIILIDRQLITITTEREAMVNARPLTDWIAIRQQKYLLEMIFYKFVNLLYQFTLTKKLRSNH